MTQSNEIKLVKAKAKARRQELEIQAASQLIRAVLASPLVQIIGTVVVTEAMENAGWISGRWAGAVEGGVITMVGLQALKDYGLIGAGTLGLGITAGSALGGLSETFETGTDLEKGLASGLLSGLLGLPGRLISP